MFNKVEIETVSNGYLLTFSCKPDTTEKGWFIANTIEEISPLLDLYLSKKKK